MASDEEVFPRMGEGATRGDLMTAIVQLRTAMTKIAAALIAGRTQPSDNWRGAIDEYFDADAKLAELVEILGGRDRGGQ